MNGALAVALAAAIVGPLVAYLTASRKLSGKIATSEASDLWAESARIRDDYRQQIQELLRRINALETTISTLTLENADLKRQLATLNGG